MANKYEYVKRSVQKRREWLDSLKDLPCHDCNERYPPFVMDWHHLDPSQKHFSIARGSFRHSKALLEAEMAKCILVCANCHRIREYDTKFADIDSSIPIR